MPQQLEISRQPYFRHKNGPRTSVPVRSFLAHGIPDSANRQLASTLPVKAFAGLAALPRRVRTSTEWPRGTRELPGQAARSFDRVPPPMLATHTSLLSSATAPGRGRPGKVPATDPCWLSSVTELPRKLATHR